MTKAKARAPEPAPDFEVPEAWRHRPWIPVGTVAVLLAVILGAGWAVDQALKPIVPASLTACATSTQLAPHLYQGRQPFCINPKKVYGATIITTAGTVSVKLAAGTAPVTVNNFVVLAINGYYDGLSFWRVDSWVVQTGDPGANGRGGPGYNLPEEASTSTWQPGSMGMARVPRGPINGSQFFITTGAWPGSGPTETYNQFGSVATGLDKLQGLTTNDRVVSIRITVR